MLTQRNSNQANLLQLMIMVILMRIMGVNVDTMKNSTRPNFRTGYPSHSSLSWKRFKTYFSAMGVNFYCLFSEAELSNSFFANIWTPLPISSTTNLSGWLQKKKSVTISFKRKPALQHLDKLIFRGLKN